MTPEEQPTTRASSVKKEENPAAFTRLAGSKLDPTVSTTSRKAARPTRDSKGAEDAWDLSVVRETFSFPVNVMIFVLPVSEIFPLPVRFFYYFFSFFFFHFQWTLWSSYCQWDLFISSERYGLSSVSERDFSITSEIIFFISSGRYDLSIVSETFLFSVNGMIFPVSVSENVPLPVRYFHFQWTLWSFQCQWDLFISSERYDLSIISERDFSITSEIIFFISSGRYGFSIVSERNISIISAIFSSPVNGMIFLCQ